MGFWICIQINFRGVNFLKTGDIAKNNPKITNYLLSEYQDLLNSGDIGDNYRYRV
jgi:hypothetical protein